jgi:hypothetical protein
LGVDDTGERIEPHQRHGAEVGEGVERHEKGAGSDRRPELWKRHRAEDPEGRCAEAASRILEGRVDPAECCDDDEEHVGERGDRESEPGAGKAVHHRQARAGDPLEQAPRAGDGEERECNDV